MSWRELMKADPPTQYSQNTQKESKKAGFEDIEDIEHRNKTEAIGYGCGGCSCKTYIQVDYGWQCKGCGAIFPIIGGSRGPVSIN